MADPFSITGSAVGVVSLAIQVCKGLEWYLSGVKEAKNKAEQIAAETEELANLLESLESIISKVDQSNSVLATRTGIVSCANAITIIRKKLKPDDQAANGGIKSSLKRLSQRVFFPFREADIKYWKDVLNTVQQSLQTALLALVIDQQRLASEDAQSRFNQLSINQNAHHLSSLNLQRDVFERTHLQLAGQSHILESGFSATSHSLQGLHTGIHSLQAKLNEISLVTESTLGTDVINLRSLQRKSRRLKRRYALVSCICRPQTSALAYCSRLLALTCTRTSMHDLGCPQASLQKAVTDLQVQVTLCNHFLKRKISLSFGMSYGAGFSIKQNLECHRVVTRSSPAFAFIPALITSSCEMTQETFAGEIDKLFTMFQLGQASPYDRLPDGRTLLHKLCFNIDREMVRYRRTVGSRENLRYLFETLLFRMSAPAFEMDDAGYTCMDALLDGPASNIHSDLVKILFDNDLQITRHAFEMITSMSQSHSTVLANLPFDTFVSPLLDDSKLLEAVLSKSDHQLRHILNQPQDLAALDDKTIAQALAMATVTGWIDGCKAMIDAELMVYAPEAWHRGITLLKCSAGIGRPDMLGLWLSQRVKSSGPQLDLIGDIEDVLYSEAVFVSGFCARELIWLLTSHLLNERHQIKLLMENNGLKFCCDNARTSLPDAHLMCMITTLLNEGIDVPQHGWSKRRSLYHVPLGWEEPRVELLESLEMAGFRDISLEKLKCGMATTCSPLIYLATQKVLHITSDSEVLIERDAMVRWFLSKGADLRETWPGSNTTALHCLAWQSAEYFKFHCSGSQYHDSCPMETCWTYEDFEFLLEEETLDGCNCGCSASGCGLLSSFWKQMFLQNLSHQRFPTICKTLLYFELMGNEECIWEHENEERLQSMFLSRILSDLTLWVETVADMLNLSQLIHVYIRLFVFSYLEMRHTCCNIDLIAHDDDPVYTRQPYPRFSPKELRRISSEDAHLRKRLEVLVPELISQYEPFDGTLEDFLVDILIPTMRETMEELKQEDKALYAAGRRELGVVMDEDEDTTGEEESDVEVEEVGLEEESDDEY